jgi:transposase
VIPTRVSIFVAAEALDLRRSFDGLAGVVKGVLRQDPLSGALFLFFNRAADRVKVLWWDRTGYCILYKRLERGTFRVPRSLTPGATSVTIEAAELAKILEGIELPPSKRRPRGIGSEGVRFPTG